MEGSEVQPAGAELSARGAVFKAAGVAWPAQAVGSGRRRGAAGIARPVHAVGSGRWFGRPLRNGRECTAGAEPSVPSVGSVRPKTTKADCSNSRPSVTASP